MRITRKGLLPSETVFAGRCAWCGCEIEVLAAETKSHSDRNDTIVYVECPTPGCGRRIYVDKRQSATGDAKPTRWPKVEGDRPTLLNPADVNGYGYGQPTIEEAT